MFYTFRQNNSGGSFEINDAVTVNVIIEAVNETHANVIAEGVGIYFDGVDKGEDCDCCGDRWYPVDDYDGKESPMVYGVSPEVYVSELHNRMRWADKGEEVVVYYLDGTVDWF
jgi:hypothetical protein